MGPLSAARMAVLRRPRPCLSLRRVTLVAREGFHDLVDRRGEREVGLETGRLAAAKARTSGFLPFLTSVLKSLMSCKWSCTSSSLYSSSKCSPVMLPTVTSSSACWSLVVVGSGTSYLAAGTARLASAIVWSEARFRPRAVPSGVTDCAAAMVPPATSNRKPREADFRTSIFWRDSIEVPLDRFSSRWRSRASAGGAARLRARTRPAAPAKILFINVPPVSVGIGSGIACGRFAVRADVHPLSVLLTA